MKKTILDWTEHLRLLYGDRNECYFRGGLAQRIAFLHLAIHRLGVAIRKGRKNEIPGALARIVARTMAVTQHFRDLPLAEMLVRKWGCKRCAYCRRLICDCSDEARPAPELDDATEKTQTLTFNELCEFLQATYGTKNRSEGVWWILQRLTEEVNELGTLEYDLAEQPLTPQEMRKEFALEAADVIAWVIAMANFSQIDLEAALEARYGTVCWHCKQCPCNCLLNARRPRKKAR